MKQSKMSEGSSRDNQFTCDKILKIMLTDSLLMAQLLIYYVLPFRFIKLFDFSAMTQLPTEYINLSTGKSYYCDLVWQLPFLDKSLKPSYIIISLELQSTSQRIMPFRMLKYNVQIVDAAVRYFSPEQPQTIPLVLPLVLHTGLRGWKAPLDISELLPTYYDGEWKELCNLQHRYKLVDAPRIDVRGGKRSLIALFMKCLRGYHTKNEQPRWRDILEVLRQLGRDSAVEAWWQLYAFMLRRNKEGDGMYEELLADTSYYDVPADVDAYVNDVVKDLEAKGNVVTYGLRLRLQDRFTGRAEGRAEWQAKGRFEGKATTLADMISWRYAECAKGILDYVRTSVDQDLLQRVSKAFATTNTFDDFLREAQLRPIQDSDSVLA